MRFKREHIYLMWTIAYPFFIKIGISHNPQNRAKQISESLRSKRKVYVIVSNKMAFAYFYEQLFHTIFFMLNCRAFINRNVSGKTEFVFIGLFPIAFIYILIPELFNALILMSIIYYFL